MNVLEQFKYYFLLCSVLFCSVIQFLIFPNYVVARLEIYRENYVMARLREMGNIMKIVFYIKCKAEESGRYIMNQTVIMRAVRYCNQKHCYLPVLIR